MINTIFFDLDDTLSDHKECEKQGLIHVFEKIGTPYKDEYQDIFRPLDRELWRTGIHNGKHIPSLEIPTYRFKILFEEIGLAYDNYEEANLQFKIGFASSAPLLDGAEELVKYLHEKGYLLCIVTNGLVELQTPRIHNSTIGKYISHIIVSEEVVAKPNPLIFETLLERIKTTQNAWVSSSDAERPAPDKVVMIGDRLDLDVLGAKNANIKSIWYNPKGFENDTDIVPDYEVNDLLQVIDVIKLLS